MKIWEALVLGIIQGLSEFLPISSSGHLLLLEKLGVGTESLFFNIMVHVGTLLAVLIVLRKEWTPIVRHPFQRTTLNLALSCIPTIVLALVFKFFLPSLIDGMLLGFGFVMTAFLLYVGQTFHFTQNGVYNAKTCLLTGVFQGIAVLPGISRSGATISALTLCGIDRKSATNFSFLLSIPIIAGSAIFEGVELAISKTPLNIPISALIVGVVSAFLSGLLAIKFFLKLIKKHKMTGFIVYTLLLGIVVTILPLFV